LDRRIGHVTFQGLRRTFASLRSYGGKSHGQIANLLGHEDVRFTIPTVARTASTDAQRVFAAVPLARSHLARHWSQREEGALRERLPLGAGLTWLLRPPEPSAPDQDGAAERGKDEAKRGPGTHARVCPLKATGGDDLDNGASCVAGLGAEDARVVPSSIFLPDDALDR
jgi:hypothetical protein